MDAIGMIIGSFWGLERTRRLLALLSDDREIESVRNTICLSPILHHWWRMGYMALEPLEKLSNGTRVRLRWLHQVRFSMGDKIPLSAGPSDHLHLPPVQGSLDVRDCRSGHLILNGLVIDLTSDNLATEVSYDLLQLQWDLLRMAALCGAANAPDDPDWNTRGSKVCGRA
ncbi:uncharacterized protein DNG_10210 [Cephalotrichum gorgonifer]|uniref:HNH nuclease domain-containing protein n=1 Tax=Cephalotrichum gorgonifer TaxID=2041049 RepID=A0AAE8T050_9PEZI|nr:uncharacterized protein DNG_10210 [Cephalotrichum gorgonifer]